MLHQVFAELINTIMEQNLPNEQRLLVEQTMGITMGRMLADAVARDPSTSSAAAVQQMLEIGAQALDRSVSDRRRQPESTGPQEVSCAPRLPPRNEEGTGGVLEACASWGVCPDGPPPKPVQQSVSQLLWKRHDELPGRAVMSG